MKCEYCKEEAIAAFFSYFEDRMMLVCKGHIERHPCIFCGSTLSGHDSFYNDLLITAQDSPSKQRIKVRRQRRLQGQNNQ